MKITSASTTTRSAIRKKTTATETTLYLVTEGSNTFIFRYDKADKQTPDNNDTVLVSAKGHRFKRYDLEAADAVPIVFTNKEQSWTATCGEGYTGENSVTIEAGLFEGDSQESADWAALEEAKKQAEAGLVCTPIVLPTEGNGKRIKGFSTYTANGSIEAGSDVLTLDSEIGALVGDTLAVFPTQHRGEQGPGGTLFQVYNSVAERDNDTSQKQDTWAWVKGVKGLFRYDATKKSWWDASYLQPLFDTAIPYSLIADVVEVISPAKVRLSKKAVEAVKNTKVVFDATNVLINHVKTSPKKTFDAKALGFGEGDTLYVQREKWEGKEWSNFLLDWFEAKDITIDLNGMVLDSIPGAFPATLDCEFGNGGFFIVRKGTIRQPGIYEGFGFPIGARFEVPERNENWGNPWMYCKAFAGNISEALAEDMIVENPVGYAFHSNGIIRRCGVRNTLGGEPTYNGFWFLTFSGLVEDCWAESKYIIRVLEIEGGDGGRVIRFRAKNGIVASNSSWNAKFQNISLSFEKNALVNNPGISTNPAFEIHAHIKGAAGNILVENVSINYDGFLDDKCGLLRDFVIKPGVDGLTIRNVKINKPAAPVKFLRGNGYGGSLQCGADNALIEDFETNARLWEGFKPEDYLNSHDNTIISVTGKNCTLRRVKALAAVVAQDTKVEDCQFEYGFVRI